jgi:hypothetical protein
MIEFVVVELYDIGAADCQASARHFSRAAVASRSRLIRLSAHVIYC